VQFRLFFTVNNEDNVFQAKSSRWGRASRLHKAANNTWCIYTCEI